MTSDRTWGTTLKLIDAWLQYIRLDEQADAEVPGDRVPYQYFELRGDSVLMPESVWQEYRKRCSLLPNSSEFHVYLSFPAIFQRTGGGRRFLPLFAIDIGSIFEEQYEPDGWPLTGLPFQPCSVNVERILGLDEEETEALVVKEGILTFLRDTFDVDVETLEEFLAVRKPFEDCDEVKSIPYVFELESANYTIALKKDLKDFKQYGEKLVSSGTPACEYLYGVPAPTRNETLYLGAFPTHPPTASQIVALKHSQANPVTATQGPPGSGKTTLILHRLAHQLANRAVALAEGRADVHNLTLLVSNTNYAIDNVIERMTKDGFDSMLLIGGRKARVTEEAVPKIDRVLAWLRESVPDPAALESARARVLEISRGLRRLEAEYRAELRAREACRRRLEEVVLELQGLDDEHGRLVAKITECNDELSKFVDYDTELIPVYREIDAQVRATVLKYPDDDEPLLQWLRRKVFGPSRQEILRSLEESIRAALDATKDSPNPLAAPTDGVSLGAFAKGIEGLVDRGADWKRLTKRRIKAQAERDSNRRRAADLDGERASLLYHLERPLADFYAEFPEREHDTQQDLFRWSLAFLAEVALARKREVTDALECYRMVLAGSDSDSRDAFTRMGRGLQEHLKAISLVLPLWTTTLHSARRMMPFLQAGAIDCVIADEAGMIGPHQLFPVVARARSAFVVGDHLQIEPVIKHGTEVKEAYKRAAFHDQGLDDDYYARYSPTAVSTATAYHLTAGMRGQTKTLDATIKLREHYRCRPPIAAFCNEIANYDFTVMTEPGESRLGSNLVAYHVEGRRRDAVNEEEVDAVEAVVRHLVASGYLARTSERESDIGVISPYRVHANRIGRRLSDMRGELGGPIDVGTVHTFQGQERTVIVLSTRQATSRDSLWFINRRVNMLNVAVSRAKDLFILVGNLHKLKAEAGFARRLVEHIEREGDVLEYKASDEIPTVDPDSRRDWIYDCDHIRMLAEALATARRDIVLMCPWVRGPAARDFIDAIEAPLARGVTVSVGFGWGEGDQHDEALVERLGAVLARSASSRLVRFDPDGTHEKLLICDERFGVVGSWNWLSHLYGPRCARRALDPRVQMRRETSSYETDASKLKSLRENVMRALSRYGGSAARGGASS